MKETEKREETEGRALKKKGNRRAFLTGAAGAAVGATAATLLPQATKSAEAGGVGDPLIVGQGNDGDTEVTDLWSEVKVPAGLDPGDSRGSNATLRLGNNATPAGPDERARALTATSPCETIMAITHGDPAEGGAPVAVRGMSHFPGDPTRYGPGGGIAGHSGSATGVLGTSESHAGVGGQSEEYNGVEGFSWGGPPGDRGPAGVAGYGAAPGTFEGGEAAGVLGCSGSGPGVKAHSESGPGVLAASASGLALDVQGPARFSTAGSATVPRWRRSAFVGNPAVTEASHITLTLTADPGWVSVRWVERQPGVGFTVHLAGVAWRRVPFTYLIVEPGG